MRGRATDNTFAMEMKARKVPVLQCSGVASIILRARPRRKIISDRITFVELRGAPYAAADPRAREAAADHTFDERDPHA